MKYLVMRIRHDSDGCGMPEFIGEYQTKWHVGRLKLESTPDEYGNDWEYLVYEVFSEGTGRLKAVVPASDGRIRL